MYAGIYGGGGEGAVTVPNIEGVEFAAIGIRPHYNVVGPRTEYESTEEHK